MNRRPRLSYPIVNFEAALNRMEGNRALLGEMIKIYIEDAPALLTEIEQALLANDSQHLRRSAHSLKGLAANIDGVQVVEAATDIEHAAASNQLDLVEPLLETLRTEMNAIKEPLNAFRP